MGETESAVWYMKAANQGYLNAEYQLGIYYKNKMEYGKALEWLKKSASQGDVDSMVSIGNTYLLTGFVENAIPWYQKAANQGDQRAQAILTRISGKCPRKPLPWVQDRGRQLAASYLPDVLSGYASYLRI